MQVREAAAAAAGEAMGAVAGVHCAGLHVEQIERQAFQFLGRCCGHLPAFQHQLMRWVYRSAALSPNMCFTLSQALDLQHWQQFCLVIPEYLFYHFGCEFTIHGRHHQ